MQKNAHSRGLSVEIPSAWEEKVVVSQRFPLDNMGSYRTIDRTEYKELVVPAPLLIQSNRQGFSYANPADRNPPPDAEYIIITIFEGKTETSSDNNV